VFVLDMGDPVSIWELAEKMIRLSGKEPGRDIEVKITGVRPGEKLHEVLWNDGEVAQPTSHPKILVAAQEPVDPVWLEGELGELERLVAEGETLELVSKLSALARAPQRLGVSSRTERVP
jgi:FlaA1/EpsC-like NDP-sugar epimerase